MMKGMTKNGMKTAPHSQKRMQGKRWSPRQTIFGKKHAQNIHMLLYKNERSCLKVGMETLDFRCSIILETEITKTNQVSRPQKERTTRKETLGATSLTLILSFSTESFAGSFGGVSLGAACVAAWEAIAAGSFHLLRSLKTMEGAGSGGTARIQNDR